MIPKGYRYCRRFSHKLPYLSLLWLLVGTTSSLLLASSSSAATTLSSSSSKVVLSHGLQNLGNTCYLNSQLQCAFHVPRVRSLIESPPPTVVEEVDVEIEDEDDVPAESVEGDEEENLQDGNNDAEMSGNVEEQTQANTAQQSAQSTVETPEWPESLAIQALRKVFYDMKSASSPVAPRILCQVLGIPVMQQQDSQEFWKLLLPALNLPALTDLYQGSFEDYIKAADGSNRERRREEPFLDLSLEVSR